MKPNEAQIITVEEAKQLSPEVVSDLQANFNPLFQQAQEWKTKADKIKVVDINDKESMQAAREARLELKKIRVEADKVRVTLKEESLLKGKAIDGMFNIIKFLVVPIETQLEEQEKFAEIQEEKRVSAIAEERMTKISAYIEDLSIFNFRLMSDEQFDQLFAGAKKAHDDKLEAEQKAEKERIAKEKIEKEEQERIRKENEKLKREAEEREEKLLAERKIQEEKEAKERALNETKLQAEKDAREKAEAELRAKQEADEKAKREAEEKIRQQELEAKRIEEERQLAPEKDKLVSFASELLMLDYPEMQTEIGKKIIENAKDLIKKVNVYIVKNINNL